MRLHLQVRARTFESATMLTMGQQCQATALAAVVEPVLTAFVLPWHTNKGATYTRWLCHPAVLDITTIS